jgi:monoamine oxidase
MPRTPFLKMLGRIADEHREADRLGVPVEAVQEQRYTRGDLLRRGGAIGAAVAVAGPAAALTRSARAAGTPRIAIVGGGIAGLSAALTLADAGFASTVYEAHGSRLGGRMHSDAPNVSGGDNYFNGQVAEYCGEFIDSDHNTVQALAKRFGLPLDDVLAAQPNASTETYFFFGQYYSYDQASKDFQPVHNALQGQVSKTSYPTLWNSYTQAGWDFDHLSVYDWIEQYVPGGHGSPFGRLLDAAYNEEYGGETTDQSSLNLIYLLGYGAKPGNFQIYGKSDERYHIRGGNQQLPETIASYLGSTGLTQVVRTARMNTIALNRDNTVSMWFDGSSTPVVADHVILCMSFSVLRTLDWSQAGFDQRKQTAITQLGSGRNAKLQLQFDTRYWNLQGPWGISNGDVYTDLGFQNTWDVTRAQPGTNGIMVNYSGGNVAGAFKPSTPYSNATQSNQVTTYAKKFLSQLEVVFPGITKHWNGKAILSTPFLDPNLLCSYSYWRVGQYTSFSGYEKAPQPGPGGPIHFAGEHCSQDFQGYMEGGAAEGVRAANEVVALFKK